MTDLVRLDNVSHAYGDEAVLSDVDLAIGVGEMLGVVGPSGSGKSTLLKLVAGSLRPVRGEVTRAPAGRRIGYVPQVETVNWNFPVTVAEVVLMGRTAGRRLPWASRDERARVADVLDRLGLAGLAGRHIRELSGGQQQRVFIARALLTGAELLLLDEPTSGVDVRTRHDVLHLLGELNADGLAVVLSTHDLNGIAAHLPRLVCLNRRVIADGGPLEVITPETLELTYGARMDVINHAGMPVVFDLHVAPQRRPVEGLDDLSRMRP
jgi:ABC-type Mn2+/Zn2+ transport system ATPase subunit